MKNDLITHNEDKTFENEILINTHIKKQKKSKGLKKVAGQHQIGTIIDGMA